LGEHGEATHGFFLYEAVVRIPWILKAPDLQPRRVPHLVRSVDEVPTMVELAGAVSGDSPTPAADGMSLVSGLAAAQWPAVGEAYIETFLPRDQFGWSALTSIRTERLKYVDAPHPELYDLVEDPGERTNIAGMQSAEAARFTRVLASMARPPASAWRRPGIDPALT